MQLVWDMDGTLLDSGVVVPAAYVATVRELGGPPVTACAGRGERYWLGTPEMILADLLGREVAGGGRPMPTTAGWPARTSRRTRACGRSWPRCAASGHPVAVFTGASSRAAAILLAAAGVAVDLVVGGDQVRATQAGRRRPAAGGQPAGRAGRAAWPTSGTPRTTCAPLVPSAAWPPRPPGATSTTRPSRRTSRWRRLARRWQLVAQMGAL